MNNFGVIELASAKTTAAPGWAYVPDTSVNRSAPANRKRARNVPGLSIGDQTVRQETKRRKEAEALDRDGGRDNTIPLPVKSGRAQGKHTPNVRKILQSQKTFGNYLDDFLALQALTESNTAASSRSNAAGANNKKAAPNKRDTPSSSRQPAPEEDTQMLDADLPPLLPPPYKILPPDDQADSDPLLVSRVPEMPSDEELRKLLARPPLNYGEATGDWNEKYPVRVFCEVCGYWGRVRCMKCGTRVCALDCLEAHREECVTRYGL
ncbi:hypothetical protein G7Z17_g11578 [Cylindrodendrum hubeiense]|uniref:HIT-type domain-containing protein n=1 Tax=Cylindrodendrum hubeiense TaxID=595255 RepID=A0A9P5L690_9HYPO|nr:hypothetical protein G7Z17_g11578 [Cylindrodendrum hubeiense]